VSTDRRLPVLQGDLHPAYVVWELTLRCDQACRHCGSRAGPARPEELTAAEALDVVAQLAAARTREVVLIGGEAYLHAGFLDIVRALKAAGIRPTLTTGGRAFTPALAADCAAAGLFSVSVSVDGLQATHDAVRALPGSFDAALSALKNARAAGLRTGANTTVNRANLHELEAIYATLATAGITVWQVQITTPLGRAADRPDLLLQPWDLPDLEDRVTALKVQAFRAGILIMPGNNLGYFGRGEARLRSPSPQGADHWLGCQAGRYVMGIESDGGVKGCPSLQSDAYVGGHLRDRSLAEIWNDSPRLAFARARTTADLWGFCATCPFAAVCLGGCSFTAHALFGRPGNNPYCVFRAEALRQAGQRERLVPVSPAPGRPFDHGLFEIVLEPHDAPDPGRDLSVGERMRARRVSG
jgi:radical SAM protein with 4Fe4S-binding SPASM domain